MAKVMRSIVDEYDGSAKYDSQGSGAGIRCALDGTCDIGASDVPIPAEDWRAGILTIPVMLGGIAVAHNVPGVCGAIRLKACDLARIYTGKITSWDDDSIVDSQLPGPELRKGPIIPVGRVDSSGTSEIFTAYLRDACPEVWTTEGTKLPDWAPEVDLEDGTDGVVAKVTTTEYSIGYAVIARFPVEKEVAIEAAGGTFQGAVRPQLAGIDTINLERTENDWSAIDFIFKDGAFPTTFAGFFLVDVNRATEETLAFIDHVLSVDMQSRLGDFGFRALPGNLMNVARQATYLIRAKLLGDEVSGAGG